ncbi:hypothetical protein PPERSA_08735 [Pseudocohnilembus persalinus]|uniref:Uncharacterized protein n=1 Tax=Pseudocohnilembus persalinus TaxID=266149 RepID=A0A0V0QXV0_PSEPJ|nr:hypothetical protein PPERSA_08735 [Pseudocohnilembus persalinus]|eukprot:KRX07058.1 hypothetical protein PPERSA_08735 [Pseudocohnilembus persalinus]
MQYYLLKNISNTINQLNFKIQADPDLIQNSNQIIENQNKNDNNFIQNDNGYSKTQNPQQILQRINTNQNNIQTLNGQNDYYNFPQKSSLKNQKQQNLQINNENNTNEILQQFLNQKSSNKGQDKNQNQFSNHTTSFTPEKIQNNLRKFQNTYSTNQLQIPQNNDNFNYDQYKKNQNETEFQNQQYNKNIQNNNNYNNIDNDNNINNYGSKFRNYLNNKNKEKKLLMDSKERKEKDTNIHYLDLYEELSNKKFNNNKDKCKAISQAIGEIRKKQQQQKFKEKNSIKNSIMNRDDSKNREEFLKDVGDQFIKKQKSKFSPHPKSGKKEQKFENGILITEIRPDKKSCQNCQYYDIKFEPENQRNNMNSFEITQSYSTPSPNKNMNYAPYDKVELNDSKLSSQEAGDSDNCSNKAEYFIEEDGSGQIQFQRKNSDTHKFREDSFNPLKQKQLNNQEIQTSSLFDFTEKIEKLEKESQTLLLVQKNQENQTQNQIQEDKDMQTNNKQYYDLDCENVYKLNLAPQQYFTEQEESNRILLKNLENLQDIQKYDNKNEEDECKLDKEYLKTEQNLLLDLQFHFEQLQQNINQNKDILGKGKNIIERQKEINDQYQQRDSFTPAGNKIETGQVLQKIKNQQNMEQKMHDLNKAYLEKLKNALENVSVQMVRAQNPDLLNTDTEQQNEQKKQQIKDKTLFFQQKQNERTDQKYKNIFDLLKNLYDKPEEQQNKILAEKILDLENQLAEEKQLNFEKQNQLKDLVQDLKNENLLLQLQKNPENQNQAQNELLNNQQKQYEEQLYNLGAQIQELEGKNIQLDTELQNSKDQQSNMQKELDELLLKLDQIKNTTQNYPQVFGQKETQPSNFDPIYFEKQIQQTSQKLQALEEQQNEPTYSQIDLNDKVLETLLQLSEIILSKDALLPDPQKKLIHEIFGKDYLNRLKPFQKKIQELEQKILLLQAKNNNIPVLSEKIQKYTALLGGLKDPEQIQTVIDIACDWQEEITRDFDAAANRDFELTNEQIDRPSIPNIYDQKTNSLYQPKNSYISGSEMQNVKEELENLKNDKIQLEDKIKNLEMENLNLAKKNKQLSNNSSRAILSDLKKSQLENKQLKQQLEEVTSKSQILNKSEELETVHLPSYHENEMTPNSTLIQQNLDNFFTAQNQDYLMMILTQAEALNQFVEKAEEEMEEGETEQEDENEEEQEFQEKEQQEIQQQNYQNSDILSDLDQNKKNQNQNQNHHEFLPQQNSFFDQQNKNQEPITEQEEDEYEDEDEQQNQILNQNGNLNQNNQNLNNNFGSFQVPTNINKQDFNDKYQSFSGFQPNKFGNNQDSDYHNNQKYNNSTGLPENTDTNSFSFQKQIQNTPQQQKSSINSKSNNNKYQEYQDLESVNPALQEKLQKQFSSLKNQNQQHLENQQNNQNFNEHQNNQNFDNQDQNQNQDQDLDEDAAENEDSSNYISYLNNNNKNNKNPIEKHNYNNTFDEEYDEDEESVQKNYNQQHNDYETLNFNQNSTDIQLNKASSLKNKSPYFQNDFENLNQPTSLKQQEYFQQQPQNNFDIQNFSPNTQYQNLQNNNNNQQQKEFENQFLDNNYQKQLQPQNFVNSEYQIAPENQNFINENNLNNNINNQQNFLSTEPDQKNAQNLYKNPEIIQSESNIVYIDENKVNDNQNLNNFQEQNQIQNGQDNEQKNDDYTNYQYEENPLNNISYQQTNSIENKEPIQTHKSENFNNNNDDYNNDSQFQNQNQELNLNKNIFRPADSILTNSVRRSLSENLATNNNFNNFKQPDLYKYESGLTEQSNLLNEQSSRFQSITQNINQAKNFANFDNEHDDIVRASNKQNLNFTNYFNEQEKNQNELDQQLDQKQNNLSVNSQNQKQQQQLNQPPQKDSLLNDEKYQNNPYLQKYLSNNSNTTNPELKIKNSNLSQTQKNSDKNSKFENEGLENEIINKQQQQQLQQEQPPKKPNSLLKKYTKSYDNDEIDLEQILNKNKNNNINNKNENNINNNNQNIFNNQNNNNNFNNNNEFNSKISTENDIIKQLQQERNSVFQNQKSSYDPWGQPEKVEDSQNNQNLQNFQQNQNQTNEENEQLFEQSENKQNQNDFQQQQGFFDEQDFQNKVKNSNIDYYGNGFSSDNFNQFNQMRESENLNYENNNNNFDFAQFNQNQNQNESKFDQDYGEQEEEIEQQNSEQEYEKNQNQNQDDHDDDDIL